MYGPGPPEQQRERESSFHARGERDGRVLKFGGTSLRTPQRIRRAAALVERSGPDDSPRAVVVSALAGVTDALERTVDRAARGRSVDSLVRDLEERHATAAFDVASERGRSATVQRVRNLVDRLRSDLSHLRGANRRSVPELSDRVMAAGERLSACLFAAALERSGVTARVRDARDLLVTDAEFGGASVRLSDTRPRVRRALADGAGVAVIPGFTGADRRGRTTTLARGGSDTTAAVVAACAKCEGVEIWTDVAGVMTGDPRRVREARTVPRLTHRELYELARTGANIVQPAAVLVAWRAGVTIRVRSALQPDAPGTVVGEDPEDGPATVGPRAVSVLRGPLPAAAATGGGQNPFRNSLVSAVGGGSGRSPSVLSRFYRALEVAGVSPVRPLQGRSPAVVVATVPGRDEERALRAVHGAFFGRGSRTGVRGEGDARARHRQRAAERGAAAVDADRREP